MGSRGQKKPKLSDLSRKALTREEEDAAQTAFLNGQPTVTAILGQAMVEYELDQLLRARFKKQDDGTWDELTGERGPLSSFSSKIIAAHAFGLFDDPTRDHLDRIRRIRNQFAHAKHVFDFEDPLIVSELRGCKVPAKPHSRNFKRINWVIDPGETGVDAYKLLCLTIANTLLRRRNRALKQAHKNRARRGAKTVKNPFTNALIGPRTGLIGDQLQGLMTLGVPSPSDPAISSGLSDSDHSLIKPHDRKDK